MDAVTEVKASIDGRIAELRDEMERLEAASSALAGPDVEERRTPTPRRSRTRRTPAPMRQGKASAGRTKAMVLDALERAKTPLTAGQIAETEGIGRGSVSTTLSKLARGGEILKADRGYALKV